MTGKLFPAHVWPPNLDTMGMNFPTNSQLSHEGIESTRDYLPYGLTADRQYLWGMSEMLETSTEKLGWVKMEVGGASFKIKFNS